MSKTFLLLSSVSGFLSVALGAFAAHGLKEKLDSYHLSVFQTGVHYQFFHTFALALIGLLLARGQNQSLLSTGGWAFGFGIVVFSGSLYLLALTGVRWLGAITPIGGVGFLIGWALLFVAILKEA